MRKANLILLQAFIFISSTTSFAQTKSKIPIKTQPKSQYKTQTKTNTQQLSAEDMQNYEWATGPDGRPVLREKRAQTIEVTETVEPLKIEPYGSPSPSSNAGSSISPSAINNLPVTQRNYDPLKYVDLKIDWFSICPINTETLQTPHPRLNECMQDADYRAEYTRQKQRYDASQKEDQSKTDAEKNAQKAMEAKIGPLLAQCEKDAAKAKSTCMGTEISPMVQAMASQFEQSRTAGDVAKACSAAKRLNAISMGANLSVGVMCNRAYPKCANSCIAARTAITNYSKTVTSFSIYDKKQYESVDKFIQQCNQYKENVGQTYMQGLANVGGYAQSQQCLKAVDIANNTPAVCSTDAAKDNPLCIDKYCAVSEHAETQVCKQGLADMCADPSMAQNLFCRCQGSNAAEDPACKAAGYGPTTPYDPTVPGGGVGGGGTIGSGGNEGMGTGGGPSVGGIGGIGEKIPDLPDLPPDAQQLAPLANNNSGGGSQLPNFSGGSGVGGGGFSGSSAPGKKKSGGDDEEGDGSVAVGAGSAGQPDGPLASNNSGDGSGSGMNRGGAGAEENTNPLSGFDLSSFLPKDDSRLPASGGSDLLQYGISEANGLSNWEKITRKMNEKRRELRN